MAARTQKKQLSLDANIVFDLAGRKDFAHDFRELFQSKGYGLVLPPTAVHELHLIFADGDSEAERVCEQFVRRLLRQRLIPEGEFNDGLILAQTSLVEIPLLVTSDKHLLDIDEDALLLTFNEADLAPVHPVHPKRLLRVLH